MFAQISGTKQECEAKNKELNGDSDDDDDDDEGAVEQAKEKKRKLMKVHIFVL